MTPSGRANRELPGMAEIQPLLSPYQKSDLWQSLWQLATSLLPYLVLWYLMIRSLSISYWITLALMIPAAGFLTRIFIIFHDCGHNSFFKSTRANKIVGAFLGLFTLTPAEEWWHAHAIHHATSSNLDKRGIGDVTTLTVEEYLSRPWYSRLQYRFFRFPLVMFLLGPFYIFFIVQRFPIPRFGRKETASVIYTNIILAAIFVGMSLLIGWKSFLMIEVPLTMLGGALGIWLFYVQHQFEYMYWDHTNQWNYVASALLGASYYRLPKILQWFTGNIGFHHVHHLSPRIPSYYLEKAYNKVPLLQEWARKIDFLPSLKCIKYALWDELNRKMVGFNELKHYQPAMVPVTINRQPRQE